MYKSNRLNKKGVKIMFVKKLSMIGITGVALCLFYSCEGPEGPAGVAGLDGVDGVDGVDLTELPPVGTYFSLAVNNNAGDMQFGSFVNYLSFDTVNTGVFSTIPQIVSVKTETPPEIDGSAASGEWSGSGTTITLDRMEDFLKYDGISPAGVTSVNVSSMYDDTYLYFKLSWSDADESDEKDKLAYDFSSDSWSKSGNEDRFYFMFPITGYSGTDFADGNGCEAFCHYDENSENGKGYMFTEVAGQLVDTWQWKATRSNPVGYIHDKHLIYQDVAAFDVSADKPKSFSGRKGDQGLDTYVENKIQSDGFPLYMHAKDPDASAGYPSFVWDMVPFDTSASFSDAATIPGVFLRYPTGSGSDVVAYGKHNGSGWLVEVRRARNTGNGDDHQFVSE